MGGGRPELSESRNLAHYATETKCGMPHQSSLIKMPWHSSNFHKLSGRFDHCREKYLAH